MTESLNTNNENSSLKQCLESIYAQLETVPEKDKKTAFKNILEDYGIEWRKEYDHIWTIEEREQEIEVNINERVKVNPKKEKSYKTLKKIGKYALAGTAGIAGMITLNIKQTENKTDSDNGENYIQAPIPDKPEIKKDTVAYEPRFDTEVYNSLPEKGKEVYTYFANFNPTPGRGYMMLDKDNAFQYIFNDKNKLIAKIRAGYGKEMGDENNTSYKLNTGRTTTPSGIYIISNATTEGDRKEYGEMQYSLFGVSVLGEKVTLGIHQTYPKQLELRTNLLNSPNTEDNKFSDGCVNVPLEEFTKNIKPYFQGDGAELMIILPDAKSRESGIRFQIDTLVNKSLGMIVEMSYRQEGELRKRLSAVQTIDEHTSINARINELMIRRAQAMKILEGK